MQTKIRKGLFPRVYQIRCLRLMTSRFV